MTTTSMLTTCRCVLTLLEAALSHCFSISKHYWTQLLVLLLNVMLFQLLHRHPHRCFPTLENLLENWTGCMFCVVLRAAVLSGRVTTPGRNLSQLRVLCPPQSASSGGWSGRRMYRRWLCWHAVMNRDEWVPTQARGGAATCSQTRKHCVLPGVGHVTDVPEHSQCTYLLTQEGF